MDKKLASFIFLLIFLLSGILTITAISSSEECFALSKEVGVIPHWGILSENAKTVFLGKPYGFEQVYELKAISLSQELIKISINDEISLLHLGESSVISGINFSYGEHNGGRYSYCAFETKETKSQLKDPNYQIENNTQDIIILKPKVEENEGLIEKIMNFLKEMFGFK